MGQSKGGKESGVLKFNNRCSLGIGECVDVFWVDEILGGWDLVGVSEWCWKERGEG